MQAPATYLIEGVGLAAGAALVLARKQTITSMAYDVRDRPWGLPLLAGIWVGLAVHWFLQGREENPVSIRG